MPQRERLSKQVPGPANVAARQRRLPILDEALAAVRVRLIRLDEMGPSYVTVGGPSLYYSSGPDIYVSERRGNGRFGPGEPVVELNSVAADIQPNVRSDGREVVFASNRVDPSAFGGQDLWVATRDNVRDPWSAPVNLGDAVNTTDNETRPSLSWKGTTLYFGRAPAPVGPADILVTTREKTGG